MDLRDWIRTDHNGLGALFERVIVGMVPREQFTARPDRTSNSIAWLMWHLARVEDVTINTLVRGIEQVLTRENWQNRLGFADHRVGTGFQDAEVEEFNRTINVDALAAYWNAVRTATAAWLADVPLEAFEVVPDLDARLSSVPEIVTGEGRWLLDFWRGRPATYFVMFSVINHGYMHLGEMMAIRGRLGIKGR